MNIISILKACINKSLICSKVNKQTIIKLSSNILEVCEHKNYGDFVTRASFYLSKLNKSNIFKIAFKINININNKTIEKKNIVSAGYINFFISNEYNCKTLLGYTKYKNIFRYKKKASVLIEIVSANPTGPLHVGHARGAFVGNAISKLYKDMGYPINSEYYTNNVGKQIILLGESINKSCFNNFKNCSQDNKLPKPEDKPTYINHVIDQAPNILFPIFKSTDSNSFFVRWAIKCILIGLNNNLIDILVTLFKTNIKINTIFNESIIYQDFEAKSIIKCYNVDDIIYSKLVKPQKNEHFREYSKACIYAYMKKGGLFLKSMLFGARNDAILLRYNHSPVYLLADIAYHKNKINRKFSKIINIFGADHSGHIQKLFSGLNGLNIIPHKFIFNIIVQMVNFIYNNKSVKLSKRNNNVYLFEDLAKEISPNIMRYVFLSKSTNSHLTLNMREIISQNHEGIVQSFRYICKDIDVLKKQLVFENQYYKVVEKNICISKILTDEEHSIIKKIHFLKHILEISFLRKEPHLLLHYIEKMLNILTNILSKYKNIQLNPLNTHARLYIIMNLISSIEKVIFNSLLILGFNPYLL